VDTIVVYGDLVAMETPENDARKKRKVTKRASPGGILTLLGKELRRRRRQKKLTQVSLSEEAGLSPNVVGRIERGVYNPSVGVLEDIATVLGVPVYALFLNTDLLDIWLVLQYEENFPSGWITELRWRRV
jgi:transcriptional regulator with XRE-family HTH domain